MAKLYSVRRFKRDESNVRICPSWVIYSMPFVLIAIVISALITIGYRSIISFVILCITVGWSIFSDKYFCMYEHCRMEFKKDIVIYRYELNRAVMPSSDVTTTITISKLSKIKLKKKTIVLKGCIVRKAPLKKEAKIKKVEVPIDFVEREEIVNMLKERLEK